MRRCFPESYSGSCKRILKFTGAGLQGEWSSHYQAQWTVRLSCSNFELQSSVYGFQEGNQRSLLVIHLCNFSLTDSFNYLFIMRERKFLPKYYYLQANLTSQQTYCIIIIRKIGTNTNVKFEEIKKECKLLIDQLLNTNYIPT